MADARLTRLSEEWRDSLDRPLTSEELKAAINKGDGIKASGRDRIGLGLFKATWDALKDHWLNLFSQMFTTNNVSEQQKRGVIVSIPKTARPHQPPDYCPITLLNTDYKILARIMANRIRPTLEKLLHPSQYCGRPGNTMFEATVREAIAFAEVTRNPCASYPWISKKLLIEYHISTCSPSCTATASATPSWSAYNICMTTQLRWSKSRTYVRPFPIQCSVRQGCPLSMMFALCIKP
jgi:hypothetical protein